MKDKNKKVDVLTELMRDERRYLRSAFGVRFGLKNGRGEYYCVCKSRQPTERPTEGAPATTRDPYLATSWFNSIMIDLLLDTLRENDPSWRVVQLLDCRWN